MRTSAVRASPHRNILIGLAREAGGGLAVAMLAPLQLHTSKQAAAAHEQAGQAAPGGPGDRSARLPRAA